MSLRFELREAADHLPIEVEGVTPDRLAPLSLGEVRRLTVQRGRHACPLGELFAVEGDPASPDHCWVGELGQVHWLGAGMRWGHVRVEGSVGRHAGSGLRGGQLVVQGDAGDFLGAEMRGGRIDVHGSAGNLVGGAYRGSPRGMSGGTLLVHGQVGHEAGRAMRRGLLVVGGETGELLGAQMLAGSLVTLAAVGRRAGAGMRRGTLLLLGATPPELLSSFRYACRYRPLAVQLLLREIEKLGVTLPPGGRSASRPAQPAEFLLYHGDRLEGGRGELLLPA